MLNSCLTEDLEWYEREERDTEVCIHVLITVEKFVFKGLQLGQLVFPGFGNELHQYFTKEVLFWKYLLVAVKISLKQVKYIIF